MFVYCPCARVHVYTNDNNESGCFDIHNTLSVVYLYVCVGVWLILDACVCQCLSDTGHLCVSVAGLYWKPVCVGVWLILDTYVCRCLAYTGHLCMSVSG